MTLALSSGLSRNSLRASEATRVWMKGSGWVGRGCCLYRLRAELTFAQERVVGTAYGVLTCLRNLVRRGLLRFRRLIPVLPIGVPVKPACEQLIEVGCRSREGGTVTDHFPSDWARTEPQQKRGLQAM